MHTLIKRIFRPTFLFLLGLWAASFNLGNFVGPTASGFFVESLGFRTSTMIFFGLYLLVGIVDSFELFNSMKNDKKAKYESLT